MKKFSFTPSKDYSLLLRQANAMASLIRSLEGQLSILRDENAELSFRLKSQSPEEIESLRDANEILTNEVESLKDGLSNRGS